MIRLLKRAGIRPVVIHVVGLEKADLDYLRQMAAADVFMPEPTIIVLNEGLVQGGRSVEQAFAEITGDSVVVELAGRRGAEVVAIPALDCMSAIIGGWR